MPQQKATRKVIGMDYSDDGNSRIVPPRPPQRAVARAVSNLGNTCYMNAVLQALAHAPELCMAMDVHGHRMRCPIYKENAEKMAARSASSSASSSRSSSPDNTSNGNFNSNGELKSVYTFSSTGAVATRKSSRRATRSPTNNNDNEHKSTDDPNATKFCALCETEHHMDRVHRNSNNGRPTNMNGSSGTSGNSAGNKPVSPTDFVHGFIEQVAPSSFRVGQQEDSHEFLRLLIEAMQKSCIQARSPKATSVFQGNPQDTPSEDVPVEEQSASSHVGDSFTSTKSNEDLDTEYPFQLFSGKIESKVTCGYCHTTSSTLDPIEDLGLEVTPVPGAAPPSLGGRRNTPSPVPATALADVSHALQRFACVEDLDSGYKCEKCGKVGKATKQMRLASIPPILTLHLKRFRFGASDPSIVNSSGGSGLLGNAGNSYLPTRRSQRSSEVSQLIASSGGVNSGVAGADWYMSGKSGSAKIEGPAGFKPVMDLRPYLTDDLQKKHGNMLCRLFAVVVHVGKNSHSGHYLAYVRNIAKNEWWKMDDARVCLVSTQEVLNAEAYMLFYRVVDHPYSKKLASQVKALNESYEAAAAEKVEEEPAALTKGRTKKGTSEHENTVDTVTLVEENFNDPLSLSESRESSAIDRYVLSGPAASVKRNRRKRKTPEYTSGEEWARSMTVLEEKNIIKFREVENEVSKHIQFTPDFQKLLSENAYKANARLGHGPDSGISLHDDCGIDSKEDINIALLRCFLAVSKNDGIVDFTPPPTPKMMTRSTAASRGKVRSSIHVVDPTDDLL